MSCQLDVNCWQLENCSGQRGPRAGIVNPCGIKMIIWSMYLLHCKETTEYCIDCKSLYYKLGKIIVQSLRQILTHTKQDLQSSCIYSLFLLFGFFFKNSIKISFPYQP